MRLDLMPEGVRLFGDPLFRAECPIEAIEQVSFFNRLRREYPATWGAIAVHVRNEGLKEKGQFSTIIKHAAEGMTPGAADILIPAKIAFVCEMKRRNPNKSSWQDGQREYLAASHAAGAFACVALGALGAWEALQEWIRLNARLGG